MNLDNKTNNESAKLAYYWRDKRLAAWNKRHAVTHRRMARHSTPSGHTGQPCSTTVPTNPTDPDCDRSWRREWV